MLDARSRYLGTTKNKLKKNRAPIESPFQLQVAAVYIGAGQFVEFSSRITVNFVPLVF